MLFFQITKEPVRRHYLPCAIVLALLLSGCMSGGSAFQPTIQFTERLTAFDGTTWGMRVPPREDGAEYTINTAEDGVSQQDLGSSIPGHTGRAWLMIKRETDKTQLAYAIAGWDADNPSDYLTGGWWMLYPGHPGQFDLFESEDGIFFVDGPELDINHPPDMPAAGTATYAGRTSGIYQYVDDNKEYSLTEFVSQARFTADFTQGTLRGCVGCDSEIAVQDFHYTALTQNVDALRADPTGYRLRFGPSPYNPDGTFSANDVSVEHVVREVTTTKGFYGGQFSNIPDDQGNPRLVTGIYRTDFTESGGARGRFFGLWNTFGE